jgi:hypothetical protein
LKTVLSKTVLLKPVPSKTVPSKIVLSKTVLSKMHSDPSLPVLLGDKSMDLGGYPNKLD